MPDESCSRRISDAHSSSHEDEQASYWMLPNNAVAQSDLDAAIQAMEQVFQDALINHGGEDHDGTRRLLLQDTQQSLIEHLKRVVDPVSDMEFQDFVDLYHVVPMDDGINDDDEEISEPPSVVEDEDDDKEEMDEVDLLDTNALGEARQLRASVRELAQSVQEIRERMLKNSLETNMKQECNALLEDLKKARSVENTTEQSAAVDSQRVALEESLQALSGLLNDSQWSKLPQQLESLQSTINVIQKNTDKNRPMSQTEAAIISRSNSVEEDNDWEAILSQESRGEEIRMTASDRLARFFELLE